MPGWRASIDEVPKMARVLIADDHALFRAGLRQFLVQSLPSAEIGESASGNDTLTCLQRAEWDLLVLDINMPDRSGLDILRHVRSGHPGTRVLVLSGYPERQYALNVLRAGASGYIAKDCSPEELLKAVRMVLQGRRYVSDSLAELLLLDLDQADKPLHSLLSDREFQIFGKLAAGHGVSEIGRELCLSVKTVSTYRTRILEKMRMKSNADLTSYALRNEIIQ
jgi:DNA-binding NarL/FixJ family response regulator